MAPRYKNQGAKPKEKGFTLAALPGHNFNPRAGLDSPEKEILGIIDEEDVGRYDKNSLEEDIFGTVCSRLSLISSSSSSIQNNPTSNPSSSSNLSSVKKSSTKSSPNASEASPYS